MRRRRTRRADRPTDRHHTVANLGRLGERLAAEYLTAAGYRRVAQNLRTRFGEIDLLMKHRRLYVAVEVKARRRDPAPEAAVGDEQLARLTAALQRLSPHLRPRPRALRVDVVAVRLPPGKPVEIRHFPGEEFVPTPGPRR